ncbi:MAG: hypothetical protein KAJ23_07545 [Maribacter sp.]|nr:hypothetical protein [Maribacter sp.]
MKSFIFQFIWLFPLLAISQFKTGEDVTISTPQNDDVYLSGEDISINAIVKGDVVAAGSYITVTDSIAQDLILAGGDVTIRGYVGDDIRAAGGKLTIDTEVGDDVIVAGGELFITKDAIINGNLITVGGTTKINGLVKGNLNVCADELQMDGTVEGDAQLYGEELEIDGKIYGTSEIVAESIEIGENAQFHKNVSYWSEDGQVDFKSALVNTTANLDETLMCGHEDFLWKFFGIATFGFWIFYMLSAFLTLLLMNVSFKGIFAEAATYLDKNIWKSMGYGLIYLFGLPLLIAMTFVIIIGIPISLFLLSFYIFSVLFGHLVVALLLAHYLKQRNDKSWGFWKMTFLALGIAFVIRLLTFIPLLGGLISIVIIAIAYGLLAYTLLLRRNLKNLKLVEE